MHRAIYRYLQIILRKERKRVDFISDYFRDECGPGRKGICQNLDPVDGVKLLDYLRHVNFTGCFSFLHFCYCIYIYSSTLMAVKE